MDGVSAKAKGRDLMLNKNVPAALTKPRAVESFQEVCGVGSEEETWKFASSCPSLSFPSLHLISSQSDTVQGGPWGQS